MISRTCVLAVTIGLAGATVQAMEIDRYTSIVADTISSLSAPAVDADALLAMQEELLAIGVAGAREYAAKAPEDAKMMNFVADQATAMAAMDLDTIEAQWHEGAALQTIGVDIDTIDHFGPASSHMDAIVHPATAIIALREFKSTGDKALLLQVKDELSEVVEHIKHIE